jgi:outer membrane protein
MRFITLLCCFLVASVLSAKDMKVGTVDLQKLFKEYPGTKTAQKKFTAMAQRKQKDLQDAADELKDMAADMESSKSVLSTKQKRQKQTEYETKEKDLRMQDAQIRTDLATKEAEMTQSILDEIKAIVAAAAKEKGVDLVLDSEKTVYINGGVDLTDDVLKGKDFKSSDSDSQDDSESKKSKK